MTGSSGDQLVWSVHCSVSLYVSRERSHGDLWLAEVTEELGFLADEDYLFIGS